ncbi:MAG TPA: LysR family transcriptional regulator, partial [Gammaproteobacteria bacterium]|nr:LysR family transcriptional regulator [Gammaproteobacteria bacterium]
GFSAAARQLGLTPAAVSRNVAMLERNLGVRLFQRSTRKLTLTEAGEHFLATVRGHLRALQSAIADVARDDAEPAGVLKVSMSLSFGMDYLLPLLPEFLGRYPQIRIDWDFENRQVDLIAEGFDAAIGGGIELAPGVVARPLAPAHVIAVASPTYLAGKDLPSDPSELHRLQSIGMRSVSTGRIRNWTLRNVAGQEMAVHMSDTLVMNDPEAMCRSALLGLGVALVAMPHALPHLESGDLIRVLPQWYADAGPISLYYATRALLPAKTRVFVDYVVDTFKKQRLAERFAGSLG